VAFEVRPADVEESEHGEPVSVARENALRKARAAAAGEGEVVLAVDTIVTLDGRIYGKPADESEAGATLRALSGATHEVISGLVLLQPGYEPIVHHALTRVSFRAIDDDLLHWYVATGEWRDRSGGYAVQQAGGALVRAIEGDFNNVVGLPLALLLDVWPALRDGEPPPRQA